MAKWAKIAIFFVLLSICPLLFLTGCGSQKAATMDPPKIAEYNKPGTVFIGTVFKGDVTIPDIAFNEQALINKITPLIASGQITTSDAAVQWAFNEFLTNPSLYIVPGATTHTYTDQQTNPIAGSGFIINPDGYLITNAHVVKMSDKELKQTMVASVLPDVIKNDINDFETALGYTLTDDQANKLAEALANVYGTYMTVKNTSSQSWVLMGVAVPGLGTVQKGMEAEITKVGEPTPGKDVAILKVNASNLPTVPLGDDAAMRDGDQAIALGYPGAATFNPLIKQSEENIKPSLTVGSVSGRKTMPGGWEVLQIDTAVTHGNSGGPLFNNRGEVIGITTFGSVNQNSQTGAVEEVQGFNFAVPTSVVKQFLTEANVTASEGNITKTYHEGVDLFFDEHYSAAKDKFKEVQDSNQAFPYVADQISASTGKINEGLDKSTFPIPMWLLVIIIILLVGGAAGAVYVFAIRKKPVPAVAGGPAAGAPSPPAQKAEAAAPAPEAPAAAPGAAPAAAPETEAPTVVKPEAPAKEATEEIQAPEAPAGPAPEAAPPAAGEQAPEAEGKAEEAAGEELPHFCAFCGHGIPGDAKFCPNCAKPVKH